MLKVLEGVWGTEADTAWEFYVAERLPDASEVSAVMGIPFWKGGLVLTKTRRGWELPGGHIEERECVDACLERELAEEIGATQIQSRRLLGFRRIINPDRKVLNPTGKAYPRIAIVPYFIVELGSAPLGPNAADCFDFGIFESNDSIVSTSHDAEIIALAISERGLT